MLLSFQLIIYRISVNLHLGELNAPSLKHCINPREQLLMFFFMDLQSEVKKSNLIGRNQNRHQFRIVLWENSGSIQ